MKNEIKFYKAIGEYGFLSNLYPSEIHDLGLDIKFSTSEHYYQYHKFKDKQVADWAINAPSARFIALLAHNLLPYDVVEDWKEIRVDIMRKALKMKFGQNPDLMQRLKNTGDNILIENSKTDRFWGCGKDGTGKNMLGKLLMELRDNEPDRKV